MKLLSKIEKMFSLKNSQSIQYQNKINDVDLLED